MPDESLKKKEEPKAEKKEEKVATPNEFEEDDDFDEFPASGALLVFRRELRFHLFSHTL